MKTAIILEKLRYKKNFFELYLNQYSEKKIRKYLNEVIQKFRPLESNRCRLVSLKETKYFIKKYGYPKNKNKFKNAT